MRIHILVNAGRSCLYFESNNLKTEFLKRPFDGVLQRSPDGSPSHCSRPWFFDLNAHFAPAGEDGSITHNLRNDRNNLEQRRPTVAYENDILACSVPVHAIAVSDADANVSQTPEPEVIPDSFSGSKLHLLSRANDSLRSTELLKECSYRPDIPARFHF